MFLSNLRRRSKNFQHNETEFLFNNRLTHVFGLAILLHSMGISYIFSIICSMYISLFAHELGHYLAGRLLGQKAKFVYISTFYGLTAFEHRFKNWKQDLFVSISGSFLNLLLAVVFFALYFITDAFIFFSLACVNVVFVSELLPIMPFDGGKTLSALITGVFGTKRSNSDYISFMIGFLFCLIVTLISIISSYLSLYMLFITVISISLFVTSLYHFRSYSKRHHNQ